MNDGFPQTGQPAVEPGIPATVLLQVSDPLVPALHLPDWFNSGVAFLLIIGFPLALFFAWVFEMTPEGLKREHEVDRSQSITRETGQKLNHTIIVVLVLALGYFAYDKFVLSGSRDAVSFLFPCMWHTSSPQHYTPQFL